MLDAVLNNAAKFAISLESGGLPLLEAGVCWDTIPNPVIKGNNFGRIELTSGSGNGYECIIPGLKPETQYFARAYAINDIDTAYSYKQISFRTDSFRFYYGFGDKIEIRRIPEKILVKKSGTFAKSVFESLIRRLFGDVDLNWKNEDISEIHIKDLKERDEKINSLLADSMILSVRDFFKTNDGLELSFTNEIVVKFKNDTAVSDKDKLISDFNIMKTKSTKLYDVFEVSKLVDVIEVANKLYESGMFEYAYPSIICKVEFFNTK